MSDDGVSEVLCLNKPIQAQRIRSLKHIDAYINFYKATTKYTVVAEMNMNLGMELTNFSTFLKPRLIGSRLKCSEV